jgi:23S rRNA pseudouridine1911/1915/1917 synthase
VDRPTIPVVSQEHYLTVPEELDGQRLDRCLATIGEGWTRSRVRKLIDQGRVELNGKQAKASALVRSGDRALVRIDPPTPPEVEPQDIPLHVVFEDEHLLVVNKPAGLVIHPAAGNPDGTLVNALLHHCSDLSGIGGVERPGIVHRLDKDTTGLLVVAKSDSAHHGLSLAFRWRKVHKVYRALSYGVIRDSEGVIDAPIDRHPTERQMMAVRPEGRAARTLFEVTERFDFATNLSCQLVTGRTHQIRVHLAHLGHAIIGDPLYAGRQWKNISRPRAQKACREFPRQALHAWKLEFTHPITEETVALEAPIPEDMAGLLDVLRST